jgi:hypothetical protein
MVNSSITMAPWSALKAVVLVSPTANVIPIAAPRIAPICSSPFPVDSTVTDIARIPGALATIVGFFDVDGNKLPG